MAWAFILTDKQGVALGELQFAKQRSVYLPLNKISSGTFQIRTDNDAASVVRQADQTLVKAYRNGVLTALGLLVPGYQKQVQSDSRSIQVNWAGIGWRLGRRIIQSSKSPNGVTYGDPNNPAAYMDRGAMAAAIINELNAVASPPGAVPHVNDTGIRVGSVPVTSYSAVGPWYYKNALQAISELSATLDGFDWELAPTEPTADSTGLHLATFNCAGAIGSYKPHVVFEYGDGKYNVSTFTETTDFSGALNLGYSLPPGFPDNIAPNLSALSAYDSIAINGSNAVYEDVVPGDLNTVDMRNRLIQESVDVRKFPKTIITFQPTVEQAPNVVPQFGTDYIVGDTVRFRAVEYGEVTVDALFRVYEVDFSINDAGDETATPILVSTDAGGFTPQFSS